MVKTLKLLLIPLKVLLVVVASPIITGCSEKVVEEIAFRKTLEHDLIKLCDKDEECIEAVKKLIKPCMESGKWREYLKNQDDKQEFKRFVTEFYACLVDEHGDPYFTPSI